MSTRKNEAIWEPEKAYWRIRVQDDGKRKAFYSSTPGKKGKIEAERKADTWLKDKANTDIRFEKLWERHLADLEKSSKQGKESENYIKHEQMGRLWILPCIGSMRLAKLTQSDYKDCVMAAYDAGKSKRTCCNIRSSLTAAYTFAVHGHYDMEKPEVKIPSDAPEGERVILQPDQLKTLFTVDTIKDNHRQDKLCWYIHAWRFLVASGMRRGEMCGLRQEDMADGVIYIRRAINRLNNETRGKNDTARREVPVNSFMKTILASQAEMLRAAGLISPWIFPDRDGDQSTPNNVYKQWYVYRSQHDIQSSLHELRHTMVSIAKTVVPELALKDVIGHTPSMDTFGVYGHVVNGELQQTATQIDEAFRKVLK